MKLTDFLFTDRGPYPITMRPGAWRQTAATLGHLFATACLGAGQSEPRSYRLQIATQARGLARSLTDSRTPWRPFRHDPG